MSEANAKEGATLSHEGIDIEKTYELDKFPVPAVMLVVRSQREEAVTLTIRDPIPEGVSADNVGLHPDYGEESLTIGDEYITLEREFAPGEEFTAIYGLREVDTEHLSGTPQEPESVDVTPPLDAEGIEEAVEGVAETEEEAETLSLETPTEEPADSDLEAAVTEAEDGAVESQVEGSSEPETAEPEPETEPEAHAEASQETATETEAGGLGDVEGVAAALASELRRGDVDEADLELLREKLDLGTGSTEARIEHLQTEVSDLQAYTDALEEFLDENGPTQELLSDIQTRVDHLETDLTATIDRVDENADVIESVEADVDHFDDQLSEVTTDLDRLYEELDELESEVADTEALDDRLADLEASLDRMSEDLEEVSEVQERLQSVFGGANGED